MKLGNQRTTGGARGSLTSAERGRRLLGAAGVLLLLVLATLTGDTMAQQPKSYPKPQIERLDVALDFTVKDQHGKPFTLSEQRGRPVLLYFYRGYW